MQFSSSGTSDSDASVRPVALPPSSAGDATIMAVFKLSPNKMNLQMLPTVEDAPKQPEAQEDVAAPLQEQQPEHETSTEASDKASPRSKKSLLMLQRERLLRKYSPGKMRQQQKWKRLIASGGCKRAIRVSPPVKVWS